MKKISGILMACALALSVGGSLALALPKGTNEVKAAGEDLWIGSHDMINDGNTYKPGDDGYGSGTATYNSSTKTLTLDNLVYNGPGKGHTFGSYEWCTLWVSGFSKLTIIVKGTCTFNYVISSSTIDSWNYHGGYFECPIDIKKESDSSPTPTLNFRTQSSNNVASVFGLTNYSTLTVSNINLNAVAHNNTSTSTSTEIRSAGYFLRAASQTNFNNCSVNFQSLGSSGVSAGIYSLSNITLSGGDISAQGGTSGTSKSYGIYHDTTYNFTLDIQNNTSRLYAVGNTQASSMKIKNAYAGIGYTNPGDTSGTTIAASSTAKAYTYKKVLFNKITYTKTEYGPYTYDGSAHPALNISNVFPTTATVSYKLSSASAWSSTVPSFTNAGTYKVDWKIEATDYTPVNGQVTFVINKADSTWTTLPSGVADFTYDGAEHSLLANAGAVSSGTIQYSVNGGEYSTTLPKATNAGNYQITCKVVVDDNHNAPENKVITVKILKAGNAYVTEPAPVADLVYDGQPHDLVTGGSATHGTVQYRVGTSGSFSANIPSKTNGGTYTVYYKIVSNDPNYADSDVSSFNATIAKKDNAYVTEPTPVTNLSYTGEAQPVVNAGEAEGGVIMYKVDDGSYSSEIPTITNAGNYTIYYKVDGQGNYDDVEERSFEISIATVDSQYEAKPTAVTGLHYTGEAQDLVNAGSTQDGTIMYSFEPDSGFSADIPQATNVGNYTIYYYIDGDVNHDDSEVESFEVNVAANDKAALKAALEEAEELYNNIKDGYPEVAKTLKDAIDEALAVYDDDNVTVKEIQDAADSLTAAITQAIEDSRDTLIDGDSGVTVKTSDGTPIPTNVNLKVEVKTNVKAEEGSAQYENIKKLLAGNEKISNVFDIKLIKTEGGVETEIQPSDIKEGMKLIIHISLPEGINTEALKILHIHNSGEIEFVEGFKVENNEVVFEVSSLSELAFVQPNNAVLPGWAIALIVIGGILLGLLFFLIIMFIFFSKYIIVQHKRKVVRAIKIRTKNTLVVLLGVNCKTYKRPKELVYKTKEEALKVLEK